ncbi:Glycerol-3-phosphate acyltransferase 3 [Varanus komodoensis]|nr:Glycerol-3-phosphate acyltransferase 3 [Varanus komodoensis]
MCFLTLPRNCGPLTWSQAVTTSYQLFYCCVVHSLSFERTQENGSKGKTVAKEPGRQIGEQTRFIGAPRGAFVRGPAPPAPGGEEKPLRACGKPPPPPGRAGSERASGQPGGDRSCGSALACTGCACGTQGVNGVERQAKKGGQERGCVRARPAHSEPAAAAAGERARRRFPLPREESRSRRRRRRRQRCRDASRGAPARRSGPCASMEELLALALQVLSLWFSMALLLIVLPSVFGVSLGISELYLKVLMKTLEWATRRIERGIKKQHEKEQQQKKKDGQNPPVSNVIIQRDPTTMENAIAGLRSGDFELSDIFYFCKKGFEAIVEDEVTQRFTSEELVSWNLLTRTNVNFHYISLRLTIVWVIGVLVRYCLLLPLRAVLAAIGIISMIVGTTLVGQLPNGVTKDWLSDLVHLTCSRILVRALSGNIYYHNK